MPLLHRQHNNAIPDDNYNDDYDDRQGLVANAEPTHTLDNDYDNAHNTADGFLGHADDDLNAENAVHFTPAALPELPYFHHQRQQQQQHTHNDDMHDVELLISNAPADHYRFTFFVFYLLGTATMTPWNFFVTAEDYWMFKFRNTTINETMPQLEEDITPMQKSFTCDLTLTASISGTTFLILNAIYGQRVPLKFKMLTTMVIILIIFIITTVFVEVNTDQWQEQFFLVTLFTVVIINICSATMSGAVFGVAGLFPAKYMTALVSGQALGGIFTALAFLGVLAFGATPHATAFVFFNIGSILMLLSISCYILMTRKAFFQYYLDGGDKLSIVSKTDTDESCIDTGVALEPNIREVFSKIYVDTVSICLLFATTLSVYPGVTVLVQSENFGNGKPWNDIYFLPVVNYLLFNTGDYIGRVLAGIWEKPHDNPHTVLLMAIVRILYIPLFLCSNTNLHRLLPTIVHSDVTFILMMISFAITNGYLANIILIMAPRSVKQHEKEMASSIMAASLSCGLAVGSMLSMVFVQML